MSVQTIPTTPGPGVTLLTAAEQKAMAAIERKSAALSEKERELFRQRVRLMMLREKRAVVHLVLDARDLRQAERDGNWFARGKGSARICFLDDEGDGALADFRCTMERAENGPGWRMTLRSPAHADGFTQTLPLRRVAHPSRPYWRFACPTCNRNVETVHSLLAGEFLCVECARKTPEWEARQSWKEKNGDSSFFGYSGTVEWKRKPVDSLH